MGGGKAEEGEVYSGQGRCGGQELKQVGKGCRLKAKLRESKGDERVVNKQ
jgi:hypothetical protein